MNIKASVNYHLKSEQVQAFHFDVDGIIGNLISPELVTVDVNVHDLRAKDYSPNFEDDGIVFVQCSTMAPEFEANDTWRHQYDQEISTMLKDRVSAKEVIVFDHTLRIDRENAERKPVRNVHNDYSVKGASQRLVDLIGHHRAGEFHKGHFGFVNVWRPIEDVVTASPLGFIRPGSMQAEDWMTIELVYPDRQGQILGVAENVKHEWFYQSCMRPDEAIIFNIFDNQSRPHLAHSALDIIDQPQTVLPRKSIETRTLVRYA